MTTITIAAEIRAPIVAAAAKATTTRTRTERARLHRLIATSSDPLEELAFLR
ncbi:MAG: hypothetical protein V9F03_15835 [Microthrixaceae bacterium]